MSSPQHNRCPHSRPGQPYLCSGCSIDYVGGQDLLQLPPARRRTAQEDTTNRYLQAQAQNDLAGIQNHQLSSRAIYGDDKSIVNAFRGPSRNSGSFFYPTTIDNDPAFGQMRPARAVPLQRTSFNPQPQVQSRFQPPPAAAGQHQQSLGISIPISSTGKPPQEPRYGQPLFHNQRQQPGPRSSGAGRQAPQPSYPDSYYSQRTQHHRRLPPQQQLLQTVHARTTPVQPRDGSVSESYPYLTGDRPSSHVHLGSIDRNIEDSGSEGEGEDDEHDEHDEM